MEIAGWRAVTAETFALWFLVFEAICINTAIIICLIYAAYAVIAG